MLTLVLSMMIAQPQAGTLPSGPFVTYGHPVITYEKQVSFVPKVRYEQRTLPTFVESRAVATPLPACTTPNCLPVQRTGLPPILVTTIVQVGGQRIPVNCAPVFTTPPINIPAPQQAPQPMAVPMTAFANGSAHAHQCGSCGFVYRHVGGDPHVCSRCGAATNDIIYEGPGANTAPLTRGMFAGGFASAPVFQQTRTAQPFQYAVPTAAPPSQLFAAPRSGMVCLPNGQCINLAPGQFAP